MSQKFSEGVAEILSMSYYNLTAHELSPCVVSALLNMMAVPASAVALYLLHRFSKFSPQVGVNLIRDESHYFYNSSQDSASLFEAKLPLWANAYNLPLELLTEVRDLQLNSAKVAGSNDVLLQEVMSTVVEAVEQKASQLSKLFLSQELRCLTGLLPVGTMHYHQNMVPNNSHVLALVEPSDLPAFEVAFKAQQAEDRPAGLLGTSMSV